MPTPVLLLAPMEGLLDFPLRDALTRVGGIDRCVSEFIRVTGSLLPERAFLRVVPELKNGGRTPAGVPEPEGVAERGAAPEMAWPPESKGVSVGFVGTTVRSGMAARPYAPPKLNPAPAGELGRSR